MKKAILCILLIIITLHLVGCKGDIVSNRISFEESSVEYSSDTKDLMQNCIFDLLKNVSESGITDNTLDKVSNKVVNIILNENISEISINLVFSELFSNIDNISNEYKEYDKGNKITTSYISDFSTNLISSFGYEHISNILYEIIVYRYDYKIDNTNLESRKRQLESEKETFLSISKDTFYNLIRSCIMIKNILSLNNNEISNLTDSEIALFVSKLNFDICLTNKQWNIVILNARSIPLLIGDFCKDVYNNEDVITIGNMLNNAFKLLDSQCKNVDEEIVRQYKDNNTEKVIEIFVNSLDEEEKTTFNSICNNKLASEYLDYLDNSEFKQDVVDAQNMNYENLYSCQSGEYYNTLCGVIRKIFYD